MAHQDDEKAKFVAFLVVLVAVPIVFVVLVPFLGILIAEAIVIAVGLYYIVKLAVKAALNESRIKIERESSDNNPEPKRTSDN